MYELNLYLETQVYQGMSRDTRQECIKRKVVTECRTVLNDKVRVTGY